MLKVNEVDISLQLQSFLQCVPVIGSKELEGKATEGGDGFGDESEIYLLKHILRVCVAMVTSELR